MREPPSNPHTQEYGGPALPWWPTLTPARSVLPLCRSPLGYDQVHPGAAAGRALGFTFLPIVGWWFYEAATNRIPPANAGHSLLVVFGLVSFAASCITFASRAREQRQGDSVHTAEAGYSWLSRHTDLPLPLCEQVLMPLTLAVLGWLIAHSVSFELGWWLVAAGASYFWMANWEYRRRLAQLRAINDDLLRAQTMEQQVQKPLRGSPSPGCADSEDDYDLAELG